MPKPEVRVLIVGAGVAGREAAAEMRAHPEFGYQPIGFIDDDPTKHGQELLGLRVLGGRGDIPPLVRAHQVDEILIAMPSESGAVIRQLVLACAQAKVRFKIVPGIREIILGDVRIEQIRQVEPEDLLGRESVDLAASAPGAASGELLRDRSVLVTGAGGSIGGEICRQVLHGGARRLILLGRGENSIFEIESELRPEAAGKTELVPVIADVRDEQAIRDRFQVEQPELVFHAAAHKHVPYMEHFPGEAVLRNVVGTRNVIRAARAAGSQRVVVISTDKAAGARSVMGATKRLAEELVRASGGTQGPVVTAVRFGNVL
ncbi:MAG TPA: SDR family NAD(P)-dependent oxidoreductase, partial [Candidatus Udaeobacter sp.]|nr:SDR family NAD(P)-dependent oxidoreductase [Candidatus Udaeobacter sp.]